MDLQRLEPLVLGDLLADPLGDTFWKGMRVPLTAAERLILHSMLTARPASQGVPGDKGPFIQAWVVAERAGVTASSLPTLISIMRSKFREIDPEFNHIESGKKEYRWSEKLLRNKIIARNQDMTLYERGEVLWRGFHRIYLSEVEAIVLSELLRADGGYVSPARLGAACHWSARSAKRAVALVRKKFADADAIPVIGVRRGVGYCLVPPPHRERQAARPN